MKARQIKKIRFSSLRCDTGEGGGVIFDIDTMVTRKCRAVIGEYGLKWQLVKDNEYKHHYYNEVDQECLDEIGSEAVEVVRETRIKYSWNAQKGVSIADNYSLWSF